MTRRSKLFGLLTKHPDVQARDVRHPGDVLPLRREHGRQREHDGHRHRQTLSHLVFIDTFLYHDTFGPILGLLFFFNPKL